MTLRWLSKPRRGLRLLGLALACPSAVGLAATGRAATTTANPTPRAHLFRPNANALRFETNRGQFDNQVRYAARGKGYGLALSATGATLALQREGGAEPPVRVSMRVAGAAAVDPIGIDRLPGVTNYASGVADGQRLDGVASYAAAKYSDILPGVDLLYYATGARELEYDFLLAAGVDPQRLELQFDGVETLVVGADGDALLELAGGGVLLQHRPIAYQLDAQGARHFVRAAFRQLDGQRLGFQLAGFDPTIALVIDPVLTYATYLGGSKFDEFAAIASDNAGNTIAIGYTTGNLFPTQSPAQPAYGGGNSDAVVVKLNAAGTDFVYATYLGGSDTDRGYGVAVDPVGNAYITGITYSNNFPTQGALQPGFGGGSSDGFVTKLNGSGGLVYSTYLGGSGDDWAQAIAVNATGEVYVAGTTFSGNFPRLSAFQNTLAGANDGFVSKLSAAGGSLVYSTYLGGGGAGGEYAQGITLDAAGGAIVVGQTGSNNFPTQAPAQPCQAATASDAFATRFSPTGSALVYSTCLGGTSTDVAMGVAQVAGAAIVVGYTASSDFPHLGGAQTSLGGDYDGFLTRVHATGGSFDYSTFIGGAGSDQANAVTLDGNGFVYVAGQTASSAFPKQAPLPGQEALNGVSDAFLAGYSGSERAFATYLGGSGADSAVGIACAPGNVLHVLGNTFSTNFPTVSGMFPTPLGSQDGFVAKVTGLGLSPAPAGSALHWLCLAGLLFGSGLLVLSTRARAAEQNLP